MRNLVKLNTNAGTSTDVLIKKNLPRSTKCIIYFLQGAFTDSLYWHGVCTSGVTKMNVCDNFSICRLFQERQLNESDFPNI